MEYGQVDAAFVLLPFGVPLMWPDGPGCPECLLNTKSNVRGTPWKQNE